MKDNKTNVEITITCTFEKQDLSDDQIRDKLSDSLNMYLDFVEREKILPNIQEFGVDIKIDD